MINPINLSPAMLMAALFSLTFAAPLSTAVAGTIPGPHPMDGCRPALVAIPHMTPITTDAGVLYQIDQPAVRAAFPVAGLAEFALWSTGDYQANAAGYGIDGEIGRWSLTPGAGGWSEVVRAPEPLDTLLITATQRTSVAPALCILGLGVMGSGDSIFPTSESLPTATLAPVVKPATQIYLPLLAAAGDQPNDLR